ncbi:MAG: hypothetical protein JWL85_865, partial [Candidatus Saccharibacteria bacterium]|nr:hypothetical protein [Candidatus Saccharibacteria bacterium]
MTVIVGVNLSDKIYLAGDSRLSYMKDGQTYTRHDNMQKVENILNSANISVACAGDAQFSQYILKRLAKEDFCKDNINAFRDAIYDWMLQSADRYFSSTGYTSATFMFAGSDQSKKKAVTGERIIELAKAYTGGKGMIKVNDALQSAFKVGEKIPKGERKLTVADTKLFSVQVGRDGVTITDTEWGEFLIYGPEGLATDDIQPKDIGAFEFDPNFQNNGSGAGNDQAMLNAFIYAQAEKHNLSSVGGSVVCFSNNHDGTTTFITGEVFMVPMDKIRNNPLGNPIRPERLNSILVSGNRIYREV